MKPKRGASVGTYSYTSDYPKFEGSRVKSSKHLKNGELLDTRDSYSYGSLKGLSSSLNVPILKTTVEYWPPDMDKEKFFSMKKDSEIQMWPQELKQDVTKVNQKVSPEKLPDIPNKTVSIHSWSPVEIKNFEPIFGPTESSVAESVSVTDPGPVVFPTLEPTTKDPDQSVVYIARGGYKKRKLKKKAKTLPSFVETSPAKAPSTSTESEIKASDIFMPEATPIYEIINEPVVNIFPPVRYTDVINNLSNLTEQSFGSSRVNGTKKNIKSVNSKPTDDNNVIVELHFGNGSEVEETFKDDAVVESSKESLKKPLTIKDIMPLEKLLIQLKQAIEERDVGKIKRIVELMEEPMVVETTSTSSPKVEIPSIAPATTSTEASVEAPTTAPEKIYLAPRIRIAQRKIKPLSEKSPDDGKLKDDSKSIPTKAATVAPTTSRSKLTVTTEKIELTSAAIRVSTLIQARRPGRRGGRSQGSNQNPRVENITTRSRHAAKNVSRRIINKNQS